MNHEVTENTEDGSQPDRQLIVSMFEEEFDSDLAALDQEIRDIDALYTSSKDLLDTVMENTRRVSGSLGFVPKQTEQLVSIKSTKIQLLKAKIDVKNRRFAQKVKLVELQEKIRPKDSGTADEALVEAIVKKMKEGSDPTAYRAVVNGSGSTYQEVEVDLDALVDKINTEDKEARRMQVLQDTGDDIDDYNKTDKEEETDEDSVSIVCDEFGIVYIIDKDHVAYDKSDYEDVFPYPLSLKATISRDAEDPAKMVGIIMGDEIPVVPQNRLKLQRGITYV